ncbi:unnamed protein product, partial [Echinostoma caproni]|uniref:Uncharacterized protein n=1 Tax=Echinostoma caproni TaxID=27848 RepID=A0A183BDS6_9TREM
MSARLRERDRCDEDREDLEEDDRERERDRELVERRTSLGRGGLGGFESRLLATGRLPGRLDGGVARRSRDRESETG